MTANPVRTAGRVAAPVEPDDLRKVLMAGTLAPSVHNTQPWTFALTRHGIEVHADTSRTLSRQDPHGRELVISCGAAVFNMRVAAAAIRRRMHVHVFPDAADSAHLATLTFGAAQSEPIAEAVLYPAVTRRHSHRRSFDWWRIPERGFAELRSAAMLEGAELSRVGPQQRRAIGRLTRIANRALVQDLDYRRELHTWTRLASPAPDGVVVAAFGTMPDSADPPLRDFSLGMPWIGRPTERFAPEEWIVISTRGDDVAAWLRAGQATERVLLVITTQGLAASFMTQALEIPALRAELRRCVGTEGYPQLLLRLGPGGPPATSSRRPLSEVVTMGDGAAELLIDSGKPFV